MEPSDLQNLQPQPSVSKKTLIVAGVIAVIVLLLGIAGWTAWSSYQASNSSPFHLVSTNPTTSNVTAVTPFIKLTYNRSLSPASLNVSSTPDVIKSESVANNVLTIGFIVPLSQNTKYIINLIAVTDAAGEQIKNQTLTFTPKLVSSQAVPTDQAQALMQQQTQGHANQPYSMQDLSFTGTDDLLNYGVTTDQESNLEEAFYNYATSINQKIYQVDLDPSSIVHVAPNPNAQTTTQTINFNVSVEGKPYKATMTYHDESYADLHLYDPTTGAQIYDSGDVDNINSD